jgi:hypothetical protein
VNSIDQITQIVSKSVGRVGEASEVAQAHLFLMQDGFGTGQTVVVDGSTVLVLRYDHKPVFFHDRKFWELLAQRGQRHS